MCLNFQNNLSSSTHFNYLSNCDLINKYNLTSVHHIPKLDKINLELNLKDFLGSYEIVGKDQTDPAIQAKAFISLFNLTGIIPYIKAEKIVSSSGRQKSTLLNYSIKISFSKNVQKTDFLFSMFVENWHKLKLEDYTLFNSKPNDKFSEKKFVLNTLLPSHCFFEADEILTKSLTGVSTKNLKFRLNFSFENVSLLKNRNNIILNLPFFWISGRVV